MYWSLSLEEQFYLLLPFFMLAFRDRLIFCVCLLWAFMAIFPRPLPGFMWTIRADAILAGVFLALTPGRALLTLTSTYFERRRSLGRLIFPVLILALVTVPGFALDGKVPLFAGGTQSVSIICFALVLIASCDLDVLAPFQSIKRILMWVGTRSYAIYLVHVPAFSFTREIWHRIMPPSTAFDGRFNIPFVMTAAMIIVLLAEANYRFLETPLIKYGARLDNQLRRSRRVSMDSSVAG